MEGGGAKGDAPPEPQAPQPMAYVLSMKGPDAPFAGDVLRDRDFTPRGGEVALGRPTNPPCVPPGGAPAVEGGGAKGDAPPEPQAPQPMAYVLSMKGPASRTSLNQWTPGHRRPADRATSSG